MLYIIGGAPRSGKSIIARKFTQKHDIPFFSIDFLTSSLQQAPEYEIKHGQDFIPKAEKLWKFVKPLAQHMVLETENFMLEGDGILPKQINELKNEHHEKVKVCFFGVTTISPQKKLKTIREWEHLADAWTKRHSDEKMLEIIDMTIEFSKYLKDECKKYNLIYFEIENNLDDIYKKVENIFLK